MEGPRMRNFFAFFTFGLLCVLGTTSRSHAQINTLPTSNQAAAAPMGSHPIAPANWAFDCIYWSDDCGLNGSWTPTKSRPGTVRLWQSGTEWALLNTGENSYDWKYLDTWLDLIAEHQPSQVIYTFGLVPCWISTASCDGKGWAWGTIFHRRRQATLHRTAAPRLRNMSERWYNIALPPATASRTTSSTGRCGTRPTFQISGPARQSNCMTCSSR